MDLDEWIRGKRGMLSIDADFFARRDELALAPLVEDRVARELAAGAQMTFREEHVDLVELVTRPVDFVLNFDFHMDCRLEYLHGDEPRAPPCSASVFETLLSGGLTDKYIWAYPATRRRQVAQVYASAVVADRQPRMSRMHCVDGRYALHRLLGRATIDSIFVCRSPAYASADTDAVHDRLLALVGPSAAPDPDPG